MIDSQELKQLQDEYLQTLNDHSLSAASMQRRMDATKALHEAEKVLTTAQPVVAADANRG